MKSPIEAAQRVQYLVNINQRQYADRNRIRKIMNGGQEAASALLGRSPATGELPIVNMMLSGNDRLAQELGVMPDLRVDMPDHTESERARKAADKRERIVASYDTHCKLDLQVPQAARWLPGYGFVPFVISEKVDRTGWVYPHLELRDSFDCFPAPWGVDQQPDDVAFLRRVQIDDLAKKYPIVADLHAHRGQGAGQYGGYAHGTSTTWQPGGEWENPQQTGVEIAELWDADGMHLVMPETGWRLEFVPNVAQMPQFYIAKRFAFDRLQGQWGHIVGLMGAMARLNLLSIIVMEDAAHSETNVYGDVEGKYRRGRNAVNVLAPGTRVEKVQTNLPYQYFQEIDRLERYARMATAYAVSADGESPNSFVTGRGLEELRSGTAGNVREYRTVMRHAMEWADHTRLAIDEASNGDRSRPLIGYHKGASYAEEYTPSKHIAGNYMTRRAFGAMAGWDDSTKIVAGLQLLQANVISTQTLQENVDGLENITREQSRIRAERAETAVYQALLQRANEGDPQALVAALQLLPKGEMRTTLEQVFMPEEDPNAVDPQAALMEQLAGLEQQGSLPNQPPPVSTVLSRITGDGGVDGGVQTVGQLPPRAGVPT